MAGPVDASSEGCGVGAGDPVVTRGRRRVHCLLGDGGRALDPPSPINDLGHSNREFTAWK